MPRPFTKALFCGAMLALAGCAAQTPPVQVTRFHLEQAVAPGEIAIEPRDPGLAGSLEFDTYAAAVRDELVRRGFHPAADVAHSEQVASLDIHTLSREGPPRPPRFSIGIGGASFGRNVGVGGGVNVPVDKPRPGQMTYATEISVQIKRRSDGTVFWEGRARSQAAGGSAYAMPSAMAKRLAEALFTGFPGESGRTITVK